MEQQVWDLQEQVTELKERLREEQEQTRLQIMKNLAKMQGVMLKTVSAPASSLRPVLSVRSRSRTLDVLLQQQQVLHEIRDSSHSAEDDDRAPTNGRAGGEQGREKRTSGHNGSGNAFSALAAVKKTKQRSRRLSRD